MNFRIYENINASGAYGVVSYPPVNCADADVEIDYADRISKLMSLDSALIQKKEVDHEDILDPHETFHIGKPILCKAPIIPVELSLKSDRSNTVALYYKYGGKSLHTWVSSDFIGSFVKKLPKFLMALDLFFDGLCKKYKARSIHADIKLENIVFDGETIKLIDYGTAFRCNNNTVPLVHYNTYFAHPPECIIFKSLRHGFEATLEEQIKKFSAIQGHFRRKISDFEEIKDHIYGKQKTIAIFHQCAELLNSIKIRISKSSKIMMIGNRDYVDFAPRTEETVETVETSGIVETEGTEESEEKRETEETEEKDTSNPTFRIFHKYDSYAFGLVLLIIISKTMFYIESKGHEPQELKTVLQSLKIIALGMVDGRIDYRLDIMQAEQLWKKYKYLQSAEALRTSTSQSQSQEMIH